MDRLVGRPASTEAQMVRDDVALNVIRTGEDQAADAIAQVAFQPILEHGLGRVRLRRLGRRRRLRRNVRVVGPGPGDDGNP